MRLTLALIVVALTAAPAARAAERSFTDGDGIGVVAAQRLDARLYAVSVRSAALGRPVRVRMLLPDGYAAHPRTRYPVLYLFHGTSGGAPDWTERGDAERATAGLALIVVMPDAGFDGDGGGYFTDWFDPGAGGTSQWETFHVGQLIPWVDHVLHTVARRSGRAVYGLSQGGFGALSYAARHPDLFAAAGAFSGAVDIAADPEAAAFMTPVVAGTALLDGAPPDAIFGSRLSQEVNWRAHDPATLAANLRGVDLRLYSGNGRAGPLDRSLVDPGATVIESGAHELTRLLHDRLERLQIPSAYRVYGPGTHTWAYWARDLRDSLGPLMDVFAHPPSAPRAISYRSAEDHFAAWGWDVTMHRAAREFAELRDAGAGDFTLTGSGSATVITPPSYRPGTPATVRIAGAPGAATLALRVGGDGRLRFDVPLGPANRYQQYTAAAALAPTRTFTATIGLDAVSRPPGRRDSRCGRARVPGSTASRTREWRRHRARCAAGTARAARQR